VIVNIAVPSMAAEERRISVGVALVVMVRFESCTEEPVGFA
jgi:hypothetical protein